MSYGSGRQGRNPAGGSPAVTVVRFSHVAIPQFMYGLVTRSQDIFLESNTALMYPASDFVL